MSLDGLPATTWWLVRISPFASKMTPEPVAVPVPVCPVVGSVAVTPSATIVTTAGLTFLKMSATLAWPPAAGAEVPPVAGGVVAAGADVAAGACVEFAAGVTAEALDGVLWLPSDAWTARYVPPDASRAEARTAPRTKPGPMGRRPLSDDRVPVEPAYPEP